MKVISDNFLSTYTVGQSGMLGGAEHELNSLLNYLDIPYESLKSSQVESINSNDFYIVGNFWQLSPNIKKLLIQYRNYIIIEYDYKLFPNRIPDFYLDHICPTDQLQNVEFYNNAIKVFCISEYQKDIFNKNGVTNTEVFHTSFWTVNQLDILNKIREESYNLKFQHPTAGIYGYKCDTKGTLEAINYCLPKNVDCYLLTPTDIELFWKRLSRCHSLLLFSKITESFSRITVEARMLDIDVLTNAKVPATKEYWYPKYKGSDLIKFVENDLIPKALNKFKKYL